MLDLKPEARSGTLEERCRCQVRGPGALAASRSYSRPHGVASGWHAPVGLNPYAEDSCGAVGFGSGLRLYGQETAKATSKHRILTLDAVRVCVTKTDQPWFLVPCRRDEEQTWQLRLPLYSRLALTLTLTLTLPQPLPLQLESLIFSPIEDAWCETSSRQIDGRTTRTIHGAVGPAEAPHAGRTWAAAKGCLTDGSDGRGRFAR